ncbi:3-dehydroshikimate dehydratase [Paramyrothecium foliicola]|nr:3-dehydroshikimate dehydratase [Paramyrothecium foliicola]
MTMAVPYIMSKSGEALPEKLKAISEAGFDGIELAMPDLLDYGALINGKKIDPADYESIAEVAAKVKGITDKLNLKVLMLQPFPRFEGWTIGTFDKERKDAFHRAKGWMQVMEAAGTDMLQIGSSDADEINPSVEVLAADLAELADVFSKKGFRIAYENWCWATRAPTWKSVWKIVKTANRPNLGLCLDTFQTAGSELADPTTESGLIENDDELQSRWEKSLQELTETVDPGKIFLLQVSDAYKMDPPMSNTIDPAGQPPRSRWSHDFRPLPGHGGYLPVKEVLDAVLATGTKCWLSIEVFDTQEKEQGYDMGDFTASAMKSLQNLVA